MYIKKYKQIIDNYISEIYLPSIKNQKLKEIVDYSLDGGKRLRSMIVLDISYNLSKEYLFDMAISIELLHTASLIIDDLPCMDNDKIRRDKPTVHIKFGERAAKLTAFYLLFDSLKLINIYKVKDIESHTILQILLKEVCNLTKSASLGQFYDLHTTELFNKTIDINTINLKTSPFFSIAFLGGYLLSGGDKNKISSLKTASLCFSNFFQIYDDFLDADEDKDGNNLNQINLFGKDKSKQLFFDNIKQFLEKMKYLHIDTELYIEIIEYLKGKINLN